MPHCVSPEGRAESPRARSSAFAAGVVGACLIALPLSGTGATLTVTVTDAKARGLPEAVVYLEGGPENVAVAHEPVVIGQRNRQFHPRVTVVRTGTAIAFPNDDNVRHWVYSVSAVKRIRFSLAVGEKSAPVVFDKPGIVTLGCNLHDDMAAWVVAVDTTAFGKSDAAGHVTLADLKPGSYSLYAWYPGLEQPLGPQKIEITPDPAQTRELRLAVTPLESAANP